MSLKFQTLFSLIVLGTILSPAALSQTAKKFNVFKTVKTAGTVRYLEIEGGFWGIIGDNKTNYHSHAMPETLEKEGLRAKFELDILKAGCFHMWGYIVEITSYTIQEKVLPLPKNSAKN